MAVPEDADAPVLSISLNDGASRDAFAGWPLMLVARVSAPRRAAAGTPVLVASSGGDWPAAFHVDVTDDAGHPVAWPFHLATRSSGALTLDEQSVEEIGWWLSPDETKPLASGDYRVVVRLDTTAANQGWKGQAASGVLTVHLQAAPAAPTDAQASARALRLADWHMLQGDTAAAADDVNARLARRPDDAAALALKGDLLVAAGRAADAASAYDAAVAAATAGQPAGAEPPAVLLHKRRAARQSAAGPP